MTTETVDRVVEKLKTEFAATQVETHEVSPGRYRLAVVSPKFVGVTPLARQDSVWNAIDSWLTREDSFDISLILTFAPGDAELANA